MLLGKILNNSSLLNSLFYYENSRRKYTTNRHSFAWNPLTVLFLIRNFYSVLKLIISQVFVRSFGIYGIYFGIYFGILVFMVFIFMVLLRRFEVGHFLLPRQSNVSLINDSLFYFSRDPIRTVSWTVVLSKNVTKFLGACYKVIFGVFLSILDFLL